MRILAFSSAFVLGVTVSACAASSTAAGAARAASPALEQTGILADDPVAERFELTVLADPRMAVEPGAEALGRELLATWDEALARAEAFHGLAFLEVVRGYAFATDDGFREAAATSPIARGVAKVERVYFSPKLAREWETIPGVSTHELSHVLLHQHVGIGRFQFYVPKWFAEGIAVAASGGAGAEGVSREAATAAILAGRAFDIERSQRRFYAPDLNFKRDMRLLYRQSGMFVEFLRARDVPAFTEFVRSLRRRSFVAAFEAAFGGTPASLWREFAASLSQ